jgi:TnpA family transposase
LGYQFSPRLADVGGARFWRIDSKADYEVLNDTSNHIIFSLKIELNLSEITLFCLLFNQIDYL